MKLINFPEKIIYSSNLIPLDPIESFNLFTKKLSSKKILFAPFKRELKEVGPKEKCKTKFQILDIGSYNYEFTVRFIINSSKIDIGYEVNMELKAKGIPKSTIFSMEELYTNKIVPYIIRTYKNSFESKIKGN